jgi:hypothetical protein
MQHHHRLIAASIAAVACLLPVEVKAQASSSDRDSMFVWTGRMAPGTTLRVHTANGPIESVLSTDGTAEVKGIKRGRGSRNSRDDRDERDGRIYRYSDIIFEVRKVGNDIVICAMYPEDECEDNGIDSGRHGDNGRHMRAEISIKVPKGVKLHLNSGNGEVEAEGTGAGVSARSGNGAVRVVAHGDSVTASSGNGDVDVTGAGGPVNAHSGNGRVEVVTSLGPVQATTGNGSITVEMTAIRGSENMSFRSGNGRVTVILPADFNGELESSTGNGHLISDFPLSVEGRLDRQRVRATIGKGGPRIRMSSGNGNLVLRKAGSTRR